MSSPSSALVDRPSEHVAVITLNRPDVLNAMSVELCVDLLDAVAELGRDNHVWVVVLTGAGRAFCSGLDLHDHGIIPDIDGLTVPRIGPKAIRLYSSLVPALRRMPQPVIAAVNGPAYGGGMCLSLAADLRFADETAVFNATGIVNGLTSTELGASWLLPRLIGAAHSNDLMLTGRKVDAVEALRIGLVSRVVADGGVRDEAVAAAEVMCGFSPFGLQMTKATCWANLETPGLEAAIELEDRNQLLLGLTDNLPETMRARRDGRAPVFTDQPRDLSAPDTTDWHPDGG